MRDIFISHSFTDRKHFVNELKNELNKMIIYNRKIDVFYDEDILLGENIEDKIKYGIASCYCTILVISKNFFKSNYTFIETGLAMSEKNKPIIPILLDVSNKMLRKKLPMLKNPLCFIYKKNMSELLEQIKYTLTKSLYFISRPEINNLETLMPQFCNYNINRNQKIISGIKNYVECFNENKIYLNNAAYEVIYELSADINSYELNTKFLGNKKQELIKYVVNNYKGINDNIKNYINYLTNNYQNNINTNNNIMINDALYAVCQWYINVQLNKFKVIFPGEFIDEDFQIMYEIEKELLPNNLISSSEETLNWYRYNNYTHIGLRELKTNKLIAFAALLPVTEDFYKLFLTGEITDVCINQKNILQYNLPGFEYILYICSICVASKYQNTNAFKYLYDSILKLIFEIAEKKEIFFKKIFADGATADGVKLCKQIEMESKQITKHNTEIFEKELLPINLIKNAKSIGLKKIYKYYARKINEINERLESDLNFN